MHPGEYSICNCTNNTIPLQILRLPFTGGARHHTNVIISQLEYYVCMYTHTHIYIYIYIYIYFKRQWKCPFNLEITRTAMFKMSTDEEGPVIMMIQTARFRYSLNRRLDCQILEMPYKGDRLFMYIQLPTRTGGLWLRWRESSPSIPSTQR